MRIVYMGTPDFAVAALKRIIASYRDRIPDYAKKTAALGLGNENGAQA